MKYGFSDCETVVIDCSVVGIKFSARKERIFCCFLFYFMEHFGSLEVKLSDKRNTTLYITITHIREKVWQKH